jgi:hypothetical protein
MAKGIRSKIKKKHRAEFRAKVTKPYQLVREQQIQNKLNRNIQGPGGGVGADDMEDEPGSDEEEVGVNAYGVPDKAVLLADMKPRFSFAGEMGVEGPTLIDSRRDISLQHLGSSAEGRTIVHGEVPLEKVALRADPSLGVPKNTKSLPLTDFEFISRPSTGSTIVHTTKTKLGSKFMIFHPEKRKGMHSTKMRNLR